MKAIQLEKPQQFRRIEIHGFDDMIDEFPRWLKPETSVIKAIVEVE